MRWASWIHNWKHSIERRWALYQALRRKAVARRLATRPRLEILEDRWLLSPYIVNTTADSGTGSLRDAINSANNTASGITEIDFNIGTQGTSSGVQTISPATPLPALTASGVFINGYSENQWQGVTSTSPLIELNGASAGSNSDGLQLSGTGDTVSGLFITSFYNGIEVGGANNVLGGTTAGAGNVISGNSGYGVDIGASGTTVQGNYIGTDITGTTALGNSIGILVSSSQNTISGGGFVNAPNVISGNSGDGVQIASGVSGVLLVGNYVGTDPTGNTAVANGTGVEVAGSNNTVGIGALASEAEIISGNTGDGVLIDSGASGVVVQGNYIGINHGGSALGNSIGVEVAGSSNTVGSLTSPGYRNLISGNKDDGVLLDSTGAGNVIQNNDVGTGIFGTSAVGNSIGVEVAGNNNTIGGASGSGNVISGNTGDGVKILSGASGNQVLGNTIGVNFYDGGVVANSGNGIEVAGSNNTLGASSAVAYNEISGNSGDGVKLDSGSSGNVVLGSYIGTDHTGTVAIANSVGIEDGGSSNTIGGSVAGAANVISGNIGDGVQIASGVSGVLVLGNYIGTDPTGTTAIANGTGVEVSGSNNTIGTGGSVAALNIISGNTGDGVLIDSGVTGVLVQGNIIGTNAGAYVALGNSIGIEVAGSNNTLGASYAVAPNFISGNGGDGVKLDSGSSGNLVLGSYIGTNSAGTAAVANKIGIEDGGSSNTIGGNALGDKNIISGNTTDGVLIDPGAKDETMQGNYIGLNLDATKVLANGSNGVEIQGTGNTIGGALVSSFIRNYISGNTNGDGVKIDSVASGNQVLGNFIGVGIFGTNGVANIIGVEIGGSSNTVGGTSSGYTNVISNNSGDGVLVDSTGAGNVIESNYVGTDYTGRAALGNRGSGIEIQGSGNTVGAGNVLSGNIADGLRIDSTASGNLVLGSLVGLNLSGAGSNRGNGVNIAGNNNTIGGSAIAARNIISGNAADGVLISSGASGNQVLGNWIGTNYYGTASVANSIGVEVAGNSNTIGSTAGTGNVISGNSDDGVLIDQSGSGNQVLGDTIGVNWYDGRALGNSGNGIEVAGSSNTLGASWAVAPNEISGNSGDGVKLDGGSSGNVVLGSYIGTNPSGTFVFANGVGIEDGGSSNTIGGSVLGARNVISGNSSDGVLIDSSASKETLESNCIGTDGGASTFAPNGSNGVEIKGSGNTIGGQLVNSFIRNYISGNTEGDGVKIDSGASGNQVQGNFIGVAASGTIGVANSVGVEIAGNSNTIGGSANGVGNVISGNSGDGVLVDSTGAGNVIQANYVGTDYTGRRFPGVGNGANGVEIQGAGNTVGAGNILSQNSADGVRIDSSASGNLVLGSLIGLNLSGAGSNGGNGVNIAGNNNTVGGTVTSALNIISGNTADGVLIASGASGNQVLGNWIGTNYYGTAAAANSIGVEVAGNSNTIGGAAGAGNVISGNSSDGVLIDKGGSGTQVLGDTIGVNYYDGAALANSGNGIEVAGSNNTLGTSWAVAFNEISGNKGDGVKLDGGSSGNQVLGSYIGTDHTGTVAFANSVGIEDGGSGNTIGGSVLGDRNLISGNSGDGVLIDSTATKETMLGNFIGTDNNDSVSLANGSNGVEIQGSGNTIGGLLVSSLVRNLIDGNTKGDGVKIDSGASANQVVGNFIGVNISGTVGLANSIGVEIGGSNNTIGGPTTLYTNVISGNSGDGVLVDSTGAGNVIQSSFVGTDYTGQAALGNSDNGINIAGNNNTVGGTASDAGNIIANNNGGGVLVGAGSGNTIRENSIYANGGTQTGPGITINSGANNNIIAPTLGSAILNSGDSLTVAGSFTAPTAGVGYVLEFFANPTGDAEGAVFLGSMPVIPPTTGTQNFTFTATTTVTETNPLITATLTDNLGDTSAFSNGVTVTPSDAVLTYHNDSSSNGQNLTETILTPSNVNSSTFGKLFATSVDGQVYAQPLFDPGVNITTGTNQGTHNVVFVATQNDSLYAIDAANGTILWHDALLHAVHGGTVTPVPNGDVNSSDINPIIGVTATPVIDPNTNTLYIEAKTKEVASDGNHYIHQLYAVNISNGTFVQGSPIVIADTIETSTGGYIYVSGPSVNGTGDGSVNGVVTFNALRQMDRPAVTEANGNIYLAFASHGDNGPYHGWVLSYNVSTLALNGVLCTTPNGGLGGIWGGGDRLPVDASGNLYFETGNGTFDTTLNSSGMPSKGDYGDSVVKIAVDPTTSPTNQNINGWGLKVVDYFTPFDQQNMDNGDLDLGSGGPILLPDSVGSAAHPHLMVAAGKEGRIYLIDQDNMGHYSSTTDNVVEETSNTTIAGLFGDPAYYNGTLYYVGGSNIGNPNDVGKTFSIANGQMSLTPTSKGPDTYAFPGDTPSISADGNANGIVWATDHGTSQLRAYSATGFNTELYTSAQAANNRDALTGTAIKFAVPTVADGEVFVGSSDALNVYGLIDPPTQPPAAPSNLTATALSGASIQLTWQDNAIYPNTASGFDIEESTDGVNFTQVATASAGSTSFTVGGLQASTPYTFRIRAFDAVGNSAYSSTANATTTSQAPNLNFSTGFANAGSLLTVNGKAKINASALELTDGNTNEAGSAFSTSQVDITHFNTQFSFQLTAATADGFTFCIQTAANTALGPTGGGLGYGGSTGGIPTSVAVKFDLYNNNGEGSDSTGLYTDGVSPFNTGSIDLTNTGIDLHSGDQINVSMTYDGTTLTVTESDPTVNKTATQSYTINIASFVGGNTAYVGFTGGTGGATAVQNILSWTYTSTSPGAAPAAPANSTATAVSGTETYLTWTNYASNQTGFHIDRATDPAFTQNLVTQTAAADATSFVDSGLTVGTTYYYRVRAFNALGDSSNSNTASAALPTLPAAVSNLTVTKTTSNEIDVSWTNNATNADSIEVFRQLGANDPILIGSLSPTTTSFADTGLVVPLTPGTTYLYSVHAMNAAGPSLLVSVTATTASDSPALQLTNDGTPSEVNTAKPSANFSFQPPNRNAEGFTSTTQGNSPPTLSPATGSLGDGSNQTGGVDPIGLYINGVAPTNVGPINPSGTGMNLYSGDTSNPRMMYNGTSFMVKATNASTEESATEETLS